MISRETEAIIDIFRIIYESTLIYNDTDERERPGINSILLGTQ